MPASFDSLLAKIIVWSPSRPEAISRMKAALDETMLLGVDTLIPLHKAILENADFLSGDITIRFLEEHPNLLGGE